MSEYDLTPDDLKQQHITEITKSTTFKPNGISRQTASNYLETSDGEKYLRYLRNAAPDAPLDVIADRAIDHLTSGRDLPRMEVIDEPLVKVVPRGEGVTAHSPFWTKSSELNDVIAQGHNINDRFGLPIRSEALVYDVLEIRPKGSTEAFVNHVAPTSELNGQVTRAGGAVQYLVPNRSSYTEATRVTSIGNDLALHQELVVNRGLGAPITALGKSTVAAEALAARSLHPNLIKGAGLAGLALSAYDATDTYRTVNRLQGYAIPTYAMPMAA